MFIYFTGDSFILVALPFNITNILLYGKLLQALQIGSLCDIISNLIMIRFDNSVKNIKRLHLNQHQIEINMST
jgi:hypothetical protein